MLRPIVTACGALLRTALARLRALRIEEALLVAGFAFSAAVTIYANVDLAGRGVHSRRIAGGLLRLAVILAAAGLLVPLDRRLQRNPQSRWAGTVEFFRTTMPFLMCVGVYTNLHDTVRFVNPHDIHQYLAAAEEWLFGGQPVLWAERFITPARTEFFSILYANFFLVAPSVVIILWAAGRRQEARAVLLAVILCFYSGYVLYIVFPAAPPRLYFKSLGLFTVDLRGGPVAGLQAAVLDMMPGHASRAAFPSLHAAVSLLSLHYAWKYCRWFFPVLLVFVVGLLVSTVYLRHHWVVDLLAGAPLAAWAAWLAPRADRWWAHRPA